MKSISFATIIIILLLCVGCDQEIAIEPEQIEMTVDDNYPNADERLWLYFRAFELEARQRGLLFHLNERNIKGVIEHIEENGVAGHCKYGFNIDNEVTIDRGFWSNANSNSKEFVIFHELGHCILLRGHDESITNEGTCESLMRSGIEECRDDYNSNTRELYLDELFSENNS